MKNSNSSLQNVINSFEGVSLEDMSRVKLMSRVDTKYVLHEATLEAVLKDVEIYYQAMFINDKRALGYETDYYDTKNFKFYIHHHNGRVNRKKVRSRKYCETDTTFLEVKNKDNTGKTDKTRIKTDSLDLSFEGSEKMFLNNSPVATHKGFLHSLKVNYRRLTLAHKSKQERVTIDFDLTCFRPSENLRPQITSEISSFEMNNLVIIEVKQDRYSRDSEIMLALKEHGVREMRMSKYCVGCASVYPELKQNAFKEKLLYIDKLKNKVYEKGAVDG